VDIGELALLTSFLGIIPYLRSTLFGETRPERATWFVWTIVLSVSLWVYIQAGAGNSAWFIVGDLIATSSVFVVSLFRGQGGFTRFDIACVCGALFGLLLSIVTGQPLLVLVGTISADILGLIPTFRKALYDPMSENPSVFLFSAASSFIGLVALNTLSWGLLIYPSYLLLANLLTAELIVVGHYHVRQRQHKAV